MKVLLFGPKGMIGHRILSELLSRRHEVLAVSRDPSSLEAAQGLTLKAGDITDAESLEELIQGQNAVISAIGSKGEDAMVVVRAARSLTRVLAEWTSIKLIAVGGAGSLEIAPGLKLMDSPQFPQALKAVALAAADALGIYQGSPEGLNWTYVSPPALIQPGERTGHYRKGGEQLLVDDQGKSRISSEDFAIAVVDETEKQLHFRERITFAY